MEEARKIAFGGSERRKVSDYLYSIYENINNYLKIFNDLTMTLLYWTLFHLNNSFSERDRLFRSIPVHSSV